jgi:hypothetical protein
MIFVINTKFSIVQCLCSSGRQLYRVWLQKTPLYLLHCTWVAWVDIFFTSALAGGEWPASRPGRFILKERITGTHWIGEWVDPRTGLNNVERRKFLTPPGLELRILGRPTHRQSLYRLCYSDKWSRYCSKIFMNH